MCLSIKECWASGLDTPQKMCDFDMYEISMESDMLIDAEVTKQVFDPAIRVQNTNSSLDDLKDEDEVAAHETEASLNQINEFVPPELQDLSLDELLNS